MSALRHRVQLLEAGASSARASPMTKQSSGSDGGVEARIASLESALSLMREVKPSILKVIRNINSFLRSVLMSLKWIETKEAMQIR